jgi:3-methyladenine DNA glycosylase/8-oxoguanine DNA glycosylase
MTSGQVGVGRAEWLQKARAYLRNADPVLAKLIADRPDFDPRRCPSAADVLGADPAQFRDAGLSWRKVSTLRDLAERLSDGRLEPDVLAALPDDELISLLTEIPGIGPWTAQGALIIALGREDVVLPGDLALRKAVRATYRLDHLPAEKEVLVIAEKWRPYRSLATAYLFSAAFEEAQGLAARAGHSAGLPPEVER